MIAIVVMFILAALPLAAGVALIVLSGRGGRRFPSCGHCGYDLSASVGTVARCPECGSSFADVGIVPPRSRRNGRMVAAGVFLIALALAGLSMSATTAVYNRAAGNRARSAAIGASQQAQAGGPASSPASESD